MTAPHTIVFDLGGVLIDWNPRYLYRKLFNGDEAAMERFLTEVANGAWNHEQDAGRPFAEGIRLLQAQHPEHADLIAVYWERWKEMIGGPIAGTVDLIDRLHRAGIPLYALTNWSGETFPIARGWYPFFEYFKGIVVSGDEKIAKPDQRLYKILIERYHLDPPATVYLDDVVANVQAAESVGFIGHHFVGSAGLETRLRALGFEF